MEGKFDATQLLLRSARPANYKAKKEEEEKEKEAHPATTLDDLAHVHVYQPSVQRGSSYDSNSNSSSSEQVKAVLAAADEFMLYGAHGSRGRRWWGTVVIGGGMGSGGHGHGHGHVQVHAGWKGWLRVEKEEVGGFAVGMSVEEALRDRGKRQEVVDAAGWTASSRWGTYVWRD